MQAEIGSVWERKQSKIPSSSRDTGQDAGSGVAMLFATVAQGLIAWCQPQPCPTGIAASQVMVEKGTGRGQAAPGWPPSSMSVTAAAGERKGKKHAV